MRRPRRFSQLGVRTEDEVNGGRGPLDLARGAIATLVHVFSVDGCLPAADSSSKASRQARCLKDSRPRSRGVSR
jgi:hypothetical protein